MKKFGRAVVKNRVIIFIISLLLIFPAILGMVNTRINYDVLTYLPKDVETMKGQDIIVDQFGIGAFSMFIVEDMPNKDAAKLKAKIEDVKSVKTVLWYDDIMDLSVPMEVLPQSIRDKFNAENSTLMAIIFENTTSADETMDAIDEIRSICNKQCFLSGMSAVVTDTKHLSEQETPIYVLIAVLLCCVVLGFTMDSFFVPILFLISIGLAILYNFGTNYFLGEISYITKALSAVLQLGVTMDYSIFLWHSYEEQKQRFEGDKERAMTHAISNTITSVVGSSITTVAGFLALCFMSFTLGKDIGIVMAKGVVFGVVTCVTILPSMILIFDKVIVKFSHKPVMPKMEGLSKFVTKHYIMFGVIFLILLVPFFYGNLHTPVYYNLDSTLPKDLESIVANTKLKEQYNMNTTHMILIDDALSPKEVGEMNKELESINGVEKVISLESFIGPSIPQSILPKSLIEIMKNDNYEMLLAPSNFAIASDEINDQIQKMNEVIKKYDEGGMLVGEGPLTRDLIKITDKDFKVVSVVSIGVIFLIIAIIFGSISLPVILILVIELAIFINMGIPYYTGTKLPFIASIVIGTIQLGATVDYAILMTTRYKKERNLGREKKEAITVAHNSSIRSVIVSGLCFFAATFGVGLYSKIDMISSLCSLMARGAIISMFVVVFILPSMFMLFDKVICKTSLNFGK